MSKCDICGKTENITAGRWIFYCPEHKHIDWEKTYDNEIEGREDFSNVDGELAEIMLDNL